MPEVLQLRSPVVHADDRPGRTRRRRAARRATASPSFARRSPWSRSPSPTTPTSTPSRASRPAITSSAGSCPGGRRAADRDRAAAVRPGARVDGDIRRRARDRRRRQRRRPPHRRRPRRRRRRHRGARRRSRAPSWSCSGSRPSGGTQQIRRAAARPPLRRRPRGPRLGVLVVLPTGIAIVATHKARSPVERRGPRPPLPVGRDSTPATASEAARLVRPVAQRRGGHRLPGPLAAGSTREDAHPPRLRRAPARPPRRGRKRGRLQRLRLGRREGSACRDRLPPQRPDVDRRASAASASPSAVSCCSRPPPTHPPCALSCPRAPGSARSPSTSTTRRSAPSSAGSPACSRRPLRSRCSPTARRRTRSPTSCRASRRGRCCSSRP